MPKNYSAMLRYKVIDECLRNNFHASKLTEKSGFWTIEELAQVCYENIGKIPSERTLKLDIQRMRSGELGFEAPIESSYGMGYKYSNPSFSIYQSPLFKTEVDKIASSLNLLKNFKGMSYFPKISKAIRQYQNQVLQQNYYQYEPIGIIKGFDYFDNIIQSIEHDQQIEIIYKPFVESKAFHLLFNPGFIKEYQQRWYLIGTNEENVIYNIAFDRIEAVFPTTFKCNIKREELMEKYTQVVGVSIPEKGKIEDIVFDVDLEHIPYLLTKPLHKSQQMISKNKDNGTFHLRVIPNKELLAILLSMGGKCKVLKPLSLIDNLKLEIEKLRLKY